MNALPSDNLGIEPDIQVNRLTLIPLLSCALLFTACETGRPKGVGMPVSDRATAPLRVHPSNPHYFTDGKPGLNGAPRTVYLTGSHTWANLQDCISADSPDAFDYGAWLDFLQERHHNFFRLWAWESSLWIRSDAGTVTISPLPFARTGPGVALDGGPKFDVTKFNPAYFERLRERVLQARERGCYVGVMLFEGFSVARKDRKRTATPWTGHPFNAANNINRLDGDPDGDGNAYEAHTLGNPAILRAQEAYVRIVVETVNDLDNVIFEISNESHGASTPWQYHMIEFIRRCEQGMPLQHPVWMSFCWDGLAGSGTMADLFASSAEIISPTGNDRGQKDPRHYRDNPPSNDTKIVINDTDHLWGVGGDIAWVWQSFTRGMYPIFTDPYQQGGEWKLTDAQCEPVRRAMGHTRRFAGRMNLAAMRPHDALASTTYCLAHPGHEYLVYAPAGGAITVDLTAAAGVRFDARWFNPREGTDGERFPVEGGGPVQFQSPGAGDWVLHLSRREN